ncbi:BRO1-domain-containing protein [Piromyces finnis]|uniref:BRO domain-containing protein 1 n=1 Tax=Piromyces finnis TaxID=1754191 RepID=A0A1Y1UW00_9FUNG|nr:BRO1-domain-containing protein [Piromyces finnis]|eukprot:ORX41792.1 BRO1-domain-containing protein [Piromyces finnis]
MSNEINKSLTSLFDQVLSLPNSRISSVGDRLSFLSVPLKCCYYKNKISNNINNENQYLDYKKVLIPYFEKKKKNKKLEELQNVQIPDDSQWQLLNQLRIDASTPEKSENGAEKIMKYYMNLLSLEKKFPFGSDKVKIEFSWSEAFSQDKTMSIKSIQYEKASVLFNLGALYSQLGTIQNTNTTDGLKKASFYFQKSAGIFTYIRENIINRFKFKLEKSSDLSEDKLTCIINMLLAQAQECYFEKAFIDKISSPILSMVAAQTSDYYKIAHERTKKNGLFSKSIFPNLWITQLITKKYLYEAIAHFHLNPTMTPDKALGERIARLMISNNLIQQTLKYSKKIGGPLNEVVKDNEKVISSGLIMAEEANNSKYDQLIVDAKLLSPLKKTPNAFVSPIEFDKQLVESLDTFYDIFVNTAATETILSDSSNSTLNEENIDDYSVDDINSSINELNKSILNMNESIRGLNSVKEEVKIIVPNKKELSGKIDKLIESIKQQQQIEAKNDSSDLLDNLSNFHYNINDNIQKIYILLNNIDTSEFPNNPSVFTQITKLRSQLNEADMQFRERSKPFQDIITIYNTDVINFSIKDWNEVNLIFYINYLNI